MKAARLSSPLSPSCPVPPRPNSKGKPPESRYTVHQERGRRPRSPDGSNSLVSSLAEVPAEKGTKSNRLVQKWRRAESRPLRKRGGEEERGTRAPWALAALACTRTPQLIHTHGDSTPEGDLPVSASAPTPLEEVSLTGPPPTRTPRRGGDSSSPRAGPPGQTPRSAGRRARRFPTARARSAPRNSRPANFKVPPRTSKRAGRRTAAASALTIDPLAHSLRRPRRRRGQGSCPGPPLDSQRLPRGPPGPPRAWGT
ncbi:uncharacterized protein DKFZp434B061-like [Apodemus sylvaticus]|uniref:uncharacterized protein DKFZp434B061-like n=1 Tax=Apodemus sylvaticus TaxID=10129 RepID=UPI002242B6E4|nr:uncharacterized protein DKFZp434B061-like [Apodemus sylvaticus]